MKYKIQTNKQQKKNLLLFICRWGVRRRCSTWLLNSFCSLISEDDDQCTHDHILHHQVHINVYIEKYNHLFCFVTRCWHSRTESSWTKRTLSERCRQIMVTIFDSGLGCRSFKEGHELQIAARTSQHLPDNREIRRMLDAGRYLWRLQFGPFV